MLAGSVFVLADLVSRAVNGVSVSRFGVKSPFILE